MAVELVHEGLAEAHDLTVGFALGIEVGSALAAAHGEAGERVLEYLLKTQELDDRCVDRGMESDSALVGTDRRVELAAVSAVHLDLAFVVDPRDSELDESFGLDDSLDYAGVDIIWSCFDDFLDRSQDFFDRLVEFRLAGISFFDSGDDIRYIICIVFFHHAPPVA